MAFVGFATIVITVRLSTGGSLTPYQKLLTHFYIDVGFLAAALALVPLGLMELYGDSPLVWRLSTYACLFAVVTYLPLYMNRRRKIDAPMPMLSVLVTIGYLIGIVLLSLTVTEVFWQPSRTIVTAFVYWTMFSCGIVFVGMFDEFIGSFVDDALPSTATSAISTGDPAHPPLPRRSSSAAPAKAVRPLGD